MTFRSKLIRLASIVVAILFLCIIVNAGFTNFMVAPGQILNLDEGNYTLQISYKAKTDSAIILHAMVDENDISLWGQYLPATGEYIEFPLTMEYAVNNGTLSFVTDGNADVSQIVVRNASFPINRVIYALIYVASIIAISVLVKDEHLGNKITVMFSICYLGMFFILIMNPAMYIIFAIAFSLLCYFRVEKYPNAGWVKIIPYYLSLLLVIMPFFTTTSPLFPFDLWCDETTYYTLGKSMADGLKLYVDVFDHKGPVFIFIYMLGYLISPGKFYGVYLIEVIVILIDMVALYCISRLFFKDNVARIVPVFSLPVFLCDSYVGKGGSLEEMAVALLLVVIVLTLPYYSECVKSRFTPFVSFMIQGLLFSLLFFSKYNISIALGFLSFGAWLSYFRKPKIKDIAMSALGYVCGFTFIIVCCAIYFRGDLGILYENYFLFNVKYGSVGSITDSLIRVIGFSYNEFSTHPVSAIFIALGFTGIVLSRNELINILGKMFIPGAFVVIMITEYIGTKTFPYYYTFPASYAAFGIMFLMYCVNSSTLGNKIDDRRRIWLAAVVLTVPVVFYSNNLLLESDLFEKDPRPQDVFVQQMKLRSPDDPSFFNCGMLDWGFNAQAGVNPYVRFYYYPSIHSGDGNVVETSQLEYLEKGETEFVICQGYARDEVPGVPGLNENYTLIMSQINNKETGQRFFLFQKNKKK